MLPRNPPPPSEPTAPKKRSARYLVEIRDAKGASVLLTGAAWTDSERELAVSAVLRLVGYKPATQPNPKAPKVRSGETPGGKGSEKN
jgi:hypothetical protein